MRASRASPEAPSHPRYRVVRRLGSGGSGRVFLAEDLLLGQRVALKVGRDAAAPERFLREFRILRELRHPCLPRAHDFGRLPGGAPYLTMDFVDGPDLARWSGSGRRAAHPDPWSLIDAFIQVASALSHLHGKGLLHQDIKPANIVFEGSRAKLIDLGIFQDSRAAARGRAGGTALYSAPEALEDGPVDQRADLYSFGVTLYRAFTGRHPHRGATIAELLESQRREFPAPPSGLPPALSQLIVKLLSRSPQGRPQSASEVEMALREVARAAGREPPEVRVAEASLRGRGPQLEAFFGWLGGIQGGEGPPVLSVEGEAGAGKSRLVEACVTELITAGARVVTWRSFSERGEHGLREVIERACVLSPLEPAERAAHGFLLAFLGMGRDRRVLAEVEAGGIDRARARAYREAFELLAARSRPLLVVVLEDVHRADPTLLGLARWLASGGPPRAHRAPLGWILTSRGGGGAAALAPAPGVVLRLEVPPLGKADIAAVLEELAPRLPADERRRRIASCAGNPGLLVRALRSTGPVPRASKGSPRTPDARLDALAPAAREAALALALLERPATDALLGRICAAPPRSLRAALLELEERGLCARSGGSWCIEDDAAGPLRVEAKETERAAMHRRIGLALGRDSSRAAEAATHLLEGGHARGAAAAQRAAAELRETGRLEEAAALLEALISKGAGEVVKRRGLEELGDLDERLGRFDEAVGRYREALAGADSSARPRLLRKLGGALQRAGDSEGARESLEGALEVASAAGSTDVSETLHLLRELTALHLMTGDVEQARGFSSRGLELLASAQARTLARVERARHSMTLHAGAAHALLRCFEYGAAADALRSALKFATAAGDTAQRCLILNHLAVCLHQSNRLREALDACAQGAALARGAGDAAALFSLLCNEAAARARLGELRAAERLLLEAEELAASRRSPRARLFLLHTRGLVARLTLEDARSTWEESVRAADALPDPLFAAYDRVCLLENEVQQGRWGRAREVLGELRERIVEAGAPKAAGPPLDVASPARTSLHAFGSDAAGWRLARAVAVRQAYLEALCGKADAARAALAAAARPAGVEDHAALWEQVYEGAALLELGDPEAVAALEATLDGFRRTEQAPGALQCSLLLADGALRSGDGSRAAALLEGAREALQRHDRSDGSRGASVLFPFLEARIQLQSGRWSARQVADLLAEASRHLSASPSSELSWLIELVAGAAGVPGARRKAQAARRRFLALLSPPDRRCYAARDHEARLGLRPAARAASDGTAAPNRYAALLGLRRAGSVRAALDILLEAVGAARGAVFCEGDRSLEAARGFEGRQRAAFGRVRAAALESGEGPIEGGRIIELRGPGGRRAGVLHVALEEPSRDALQFLEAAADALAEVLARARRLDAATPHSPQAPEVRTRTRTIHSAAFLGSDSPRMREIVTLIQKLRESRLPVLLTGESGTGKDFLARWIHALGPRREQAFVAQDCSAIPAGLLEAELFGYEAGAFTGAERAHVGCLVSAQGGTFYLDNVDSLSLEVQGKLVRVLQTGAVRALGAASEERLDVRIIASSQRSLDELVERGEVRGDLYYRLSGVAIALPPLRERLDDIPGLLRHFETQIGGPWPRFSADAVAALQTHDWPGNVRELETVVRRLVLTCGGAVEQHDVRRVLGVRGGPRSIPRWIFEGRTMEQAVEQVRREYLLQLFEEHGGDMDQVAASLGLTRRNAYLNFARAGLKPEELRGQARSEP